MTSLDGLAVVALFRLSPYASAAGIVDPALAAEQTIAPTLPGTPTAWGSAIDKSQNVPDGRSVGLAEVEVLS